MYVGYDISKVQCYMGRCICREQERVTYFGSKSDTLKNTDNYVTNISCWKYRKYQRFSNVSNWYFLRYQINQCSFFTGRHSLEPHPDHHIYDFYCKALVNQDAKKFNVQFSLRSNNSLYFINYANCLLKKFAKMRSLIYSFICIK